MAERFAGSSVGMMPWCAVTLPSFQARERCERSSWPMIGRSEGSVLSKLSRTVGTSANMLRAGSRNPNVGTSWPCASRTRPARSQGSLEHPAQAAWNNLLKRSQVEQQRRAFAHALCLDRHHLRAARSADLLYGLLGDGLLQAAAGVVGAAIGRNPLRGESLAARGQGHVDGPERHRLEGRDLAVAVHDELQGRRLDAADGQHAVVAGLTPEHREQPAEVHTHEPVGARARQCRVVHRQRVGRRPQLAECGADRSIVECRQP